MSRNLGIQLNRSSAMNVFVNMVLKTGWQEKGCVATPNKAFKPLAKLARTLSTPHRVAFGFAIFTQTALHAERRLTGR